MYSISISINGAFHCHVNLFQILIRIYTCFRMWCDMRLYLCFYVCHWTCMVYAIPLCAMRNRLAWRPLLPTINVPRASFTHPISHGEQNELKNKSMLLHGYSRGTYTLYVIQLVRRKMGNMYVPDRHICIYMSNGLQYVRRFNYSSTLSVVRWRSSVHLNRSGQDSGTTAMQCNEYHRIILHWCTSIDQ